MNRNHSNNRNFVENDMLVVFKKVSEELEVVVAVMEFDGVGGMPELGGDKLRAILVGGGGGGVSQEDFSSNVNSQKRGIPVENARKI